MLLICTLYLYIQSKILLLELFVYSEILCRVLPFIISYRCIGFGTKIVLSGVYKTNSYCTSKSFFKLVQVHIKSNLNRV